MSGHSPGPWKVGDCDCFIIWAGGYRSTEWKEHEPGPEAVEIGNAACPGWGRVTLNDPDEQDAWIDECKANARLIAAAPALLEALEAAIPFIGYQSHVPDILEKSEAAVAAAKQDKGGE